MYIYHQSAGRLGNSIIRYLISTIFAIEYGDYILCETDFSQYKKYTNYYIYKEHEFVKWKNYRIKNNHALEMNDFLQTDMVVFEGCFQYFDILKIYKQRIFDYLREHTEYILTMPDNFKDKYYIRDILFTPANFHKYYDIVVHVRLEDFINIDKIHHPYCLENVINNIIVYEQDIDKNNVCFVCNKTTSELERTYLNFFANKYNVVFESNDIITDFHIMKNAKILLCSLSTFSWCSAYFSDSIKRIYFPAYDIDKVYREPPIDNVIFYEPKIITKKELESLFIEIL
jgi:hypothetical protein